MSSATFEGSFRVLLSADEAFPLFSPLGERAWVSGWNPELLYPPGAEWETGLVFRTIHDGQESIWFVRALDREVHSVTYDRVDVGLTATTVSVRCSGEGDAVTRVTVRYTYVGLSEAGDAFVASQTEDDYAARMRHWEELIAAMPRK